MFHVGRLRSNSIPSWHRREHLLRLLPCSRQIPMGGSRLIAVIQQWEADDIIRPVADGQSLFGECLHLLTKTPLNAQFQAYLRRGAALAISEMRSG